MEGCGCHGGMKKCGAHCKLCPFMPVILGVIMFFLGYFLDATVVRIMWLVFSGSIVLMGITCFIVTRFMKKKVSES